MSETIWYETNMTSNDKPSPLKASASSEYQGASFYPAYQAFDGKVGAVKFWRTYTDNFPYWLKIDFNKRIQVNKVRVQATDSDLPSHPTEFKIYSSIDDVEYKELGHFTNINSWSANETREFKINDTTARYFRINVISSGASYTTIGEVTYGYENTNKTFILHDGEYKTVELIPSKVVEPEGKTPQSLVPLMTSNTAPMGVALASEEISAGDRAYRAFDGSFNTDNTGWMANSRKAWIQYQFANNKRYKVIKYRMKPVQRTPSTDPFHLNRAPKTWTFEGSNDGVNFEILDTQNMTSSWTNNFRDFEIDNDKYYNIYRVNITAPMSDSETYITIGEIQYIGKIFSEDELTVIYDKQWTTIPSTLPTHTKFNDYGMDNLSPLLDRAVTEFAPLPMSDKSEILGVDVIGKVFSKTIDLKKYFDIRSIRTQVK